MSKLIIEKYIKKLEEEIKFIQNIIDTKEEKIKENLINLTEDEKLFLDSEIIDKQIYQDGLKYALNLAKKFEDIYDIEVNEDKR